MTSSCTYDLAKTSDAEEIVVADADEKSARKLVELVDDDRVRFESVDATDADDIARVLSGADYAVNGLPYQFEENVLDAILSVGGIDAVDLNAFEFDAVLGRSAAFADADCRLWFANGGLVSTIVLGLLGCRQFDSVSDVSFYWGMWRLLTQTTPGLTDTVTYEHDPAVDERVRWKEGEVIDGLPAFGDRREFAFPEPIGEQETYVITHPEPITFPKASVADETGVERIITRGVWHPEWERYERTLHAMDAFDADPVSVRGAGDVDPVAVTQRQVKRAGAVEEWQPPADLSPETDWTPQTILSAEVTGTVDGHRETAVRHLTQPFPFFGGHDITLLREYGCYVGAPLSVTLQLLAEGAVDAEGVFVTETSGLDPDRYVDEMERRGFELSRERRSTG
ncbi:MAG: Saccharopine dehydrogenase related protein [uncultured archaeon A07HR67]|jgi:Saccharopine dehydrogenase and related proteins|nr:MAG: Saccharopine dehydrogenase related protein [uncultured archaeon A07HR67]